MRATVRHVHIKVSSGEQSNQVVHVDLLTGQRQTLYSLRVTLQAWQAWTRFVYGEADAGTLMTKGSGEQANLNPLNSTVISPL